MFIPSSIQKYFFDGKTTTKRFQGSRGHAVNLLSPLPQKELKNPAIYFFESPIDALAYAQINSIGDNSLLVSFGGMPPSAFLSKISHFIAHWQASSYTICFDNDDAGIAGAKKIAGYLPKEEVTVELPPEGAKDWGEALKNLNCKMEKMEKKKKHVEHWDGECTIRNYGCDGWCDGYCENQDEASAE